MITTTDPTPLNAKGEGGDLVSNSTGSVPKSEAEQRSALNTLNQDFTTRQRLTLTIVTDTGRTVRVTQERTLTNTVSGAPPLAGGRIRGYTFTMSKPKLKL